MKTMHFFLLSIFGDDLKRFNGASCRQRCQQASVGRAAVRCNAIVAMNCRRPDELLINIYYG